MRRGVSNINSDTTSTNIPGLPGLGERNSSTNQKRLSYIESKNRRSFISRELLKMNERRKKIQYSF